MGARAGKGRWKGLERSQPFGGWRRRGGGGGGGGYERRDGPGSYGIIYLTGRETKRTKHCRGVAPQTEALGEKRREREREGAKGGGQEQRELKLGTKVLTFVPSKVFRIMIVVARREGGGRRWRAKRILCDLYLAKVSELLNFPAPGRKKARVETRRERGARGERKRERKSELVL